MGEKTDSVKPPKISEQTMRDIAKFFMKTSIPRIIAAESQKLNERSDQGEKKESVHT
jgi:hypothetical protein